MLASYFAFALVLFLSQLSSITCKAITHHPHSLSSRSLDAKDFRRQDTYESRDSLNTRAADSRQSINGGGPDATKINNAINQACTSAIAGIRDFNSDSGLGGCYNIMYLNRSTGEFQADLRLYKVADPTGNFSGIAIENMLVNLNSNYAQFAQVAVTGNTKRAEMESRQSSSNQTYDEVLEGLWQGQIEPLDYTKLTDADFMALMIPEFDIRAIQPKTEIPVNSQLNTSSAVYFVTGGVIAQSEQEAITATQSASAEAAVAKASVFILPGTTLGIFPTGLIVTGTWALLFILTFGLGTVGRIKYRRLYRSRLVALGRLRSL